MYAAPRRCRSTSSIRARLQGPPAGGIRLDRGRARGVRQPAAKGWAEAGNRRTWPAGVEVKVVNESGEQLPPGIAGELLVKGPNVMQGYLNKPEETTKTLRDGWLYTGDVATIDRSGYIRIIDRKKDMFIVDGLNVYPSEVEDVLYRHDAIKDCSMIGMPASMKKARNWGSCMWCSRMGRKPRRRNSGNISPNTWRTSRYPGGSSSPKTSENRDRQDHEKRT